MNTVTFRPSIDWSHELLNSILWVLQTFAITAPCLIVVLVVIGRMTEWGRQFWRITGDYFKGRQSLPVWAMLALLLVSTIVSVRITVLLSYYINDIFTALQLSFSRCRKRGRRACTGSGSIDRWFSLSWPCATSFACSLDLYVTQRFIMRWRIWLSHRFD